MSKKQSSVEWFASVTAQLGYVSMEILEQAKAMHKEEMISSYKNAMASAYFNTHNWMPQEGYIHKSEQYYNETYGGQDESNH